MRVREQELWNFQGGDRGWYSTGDGEVVFAVEDTHFLARDNGDEEREENGREKQVDCHSMALQLEDVWVYV